MMGNTLLEIKGKQWPGTVHMMGNTLLEIKGKQ